ncbi:MAG: hypothetical protein EA401_06845 [Planctomycetota bacterium]|nr:MAG: hypothetical protein EA401_06845 [Planctomycetota bacterium]
MAPASIIIGILLIAFSLGFKFATGTDHFTVYIPIFFGAPLLLLGIIMQLMRGPGRRHVAHLGAVIALLGTVSGLGMGVPGGIRLLMGQEGRTNAVILSLVLGVLCAVLLVVAIRSFIAARRARLAEQAHNAASDQE